MKYDLDEIESRHRFRVEGGLLNQINSQIVFLVEERGFKVSAGFDFAPALINYVIERTPPTYWVEGVWWSNINETRKKRNPKFNPAKEFSYTDKVLITIFRLVDVVTNADLTTLNMIIEDFVKEKVR